MALAGNWHMEFKKLVNRDGSGTVTLNKQDLALDGLIDDDGNVRKDQQMHVQRVAKGSYLVRVVRDGEVPELYDIFPQLKAPIVAPVERESAVERVRSRH